MSGDNMYALFKNDMNLGFYKVKNTCNFIRYYSVLN